MNLEDIKNEPSYQRALRGLTQKQKEETRELIQLLIDRDTFEIGDMPLIGLYIQTKILLDASRDDILENGFSISSVTEKGTAIKQSPSIQTSIKLTAQLVNILAQLGLTVASRKRLSLESAPKESSIESILKL